MKPPKVGTISARIWAIAGRMSGPGHPAPRRDVVAACVDEGINPRTANTQYGHWKRASFPDRTARVPRVAQVALGAAPAPDPVVQPGAPQDGHWSRLLRAGFTYVADFAAGPDGEPVLDVPAPKDPGVYAIVRDQQVVYIGVTSRTLHKRMADYRRGHTGQHTSHHIHTRLTVALRQGRRMRLLCAVPGQSEWNGLPVSVAPGLEEGLIRLYRPDWNRR